MTARARLHAMASEWDEHRLPEDDGSPRFAALMSELLFHGDTRFRDYVHYTQDQEFPAYLEAWLLNLESADDRKLLCRLLYWTLFVDRRQLDALHRDVYRRIIEPWLVTNMAAPPDFFGPALEIQLRQELKRNAVFSVTESFDGPRFIRVNELGQLRKIRSVDESGSRLLERMAEIQPAPRGVIVLEDVVASGQQTVDVLATLADLRAQGLNVLFAPLLLFEQGMENLRTAVPAIADAIRPCQLLPKSRCVGPQPTTNEPAEFSAFRDLLQRTAPRTTAPLNAGEPKIGPFGYRETGALVATCHNVPDNAPPAIHHLAPAWKPLFRRLQHGG